LSLGSILPEVFRQELCNGQHCTSISRGEGASQYTRRSRPAQTACKSLGGIKEPLIWITSSLVPPDSPKFGHTALGQDEPDSSNSTTTPLCTFGPALTATDCATSLTPTGPPTALSLDVASPSLRVSSGARLAACMSTVQKRYQGGRVW